MTYTVTSKTDVFRKEGGFRLTPEDVPKCRTALAFMMIDEKYQASLPAKDLEYLVGEGHLKVKKEGGIN